jgi:alpha-glucuronidase
VNQVREFQKVWDKAGSYVDSTRFMEVQSKLREECANAILWKDACTLYFQQFSKMPIPYDLERQINNLDNIIANEFKHEND